MNNIEIRGAKTHNLKNISLSIPRDKLVVITGLSGSGKSSLAFDTLYAEGQRRYVESLSAYARQFLSLMEKPDVEHIEGLSPAISIEQKSTSHNPRSTVGTITEIYDYLRLLFARIGDPRCPTHGVTLHAQTVSQMVDTILEQPEGTKMMLLAPIVKGRKGEHVKTFESLAAQGFLRARIDGDVCDLSDPPKLALHKKHTIEVVVDRFKVRDDLKQRLAESVETTLELSNGSAILAHMDDSQPEQLFSANFSCPHCGYSIAELEPRIFSFNSPAGACETCDGLGVEQYFDEALVVTDPTLSLADGAIEGWSSKSNYYYQILRAVAEHYGFSLTAPFKSLSKKHQQYVLQGTGAEKIAFTYSNDKGDLVSRLHAFEGVIPNRSRRYKETESPAMREYLSKYMNRQSCSSCGGSRLKESSRHVFINDVNLSHVSALSIADAEQFFENIKLVGQKAKIAEKILKEILERLSFLVNVGLNYLSLERSAETLSGGEAQRIRLASQIGAGLMGVMYVLDEPSIGLHQRDNERLLKTLTHLRDLGNTVIVVEHDEDAIRQADHIIDIGPGAGIHGGEIIAEGSYKKILKSKDSLTADYLSGRKEIVVPAQRTPLTDKWVKLKEASANNLKSVNLDLPLGVLTCITGVSGSGKSTLINDTLFPLAQTKLNKATTIQAAAHKSITGLSQLDKVVDINQSPIGRTPRSNPATYTGIFTPIRELFAATPESRSRGYKPGRFSFNVKGGRCEACQGDGMIKVEMHFLPDVYVPCDSCKGQRYNRETLSVKYKGKNIHETLDMTVEDAFKFFEAVPVIARKLQTLMDVGLSYIRLGQAATTLSGGEAQRVKLAKELSKRDTGKTLYILDEPTTGLHFHDIAQLLKVIHTLRDKGNTLVIIEHNLDVIKTADWIIDLGPEGGNGGGEIIATGTPEDVVKVKGSYTGQFLKPILEKSTSA
ncbi:excinuclease ABC subunit UvrA [Psychromonas sp. 14N.309.X.WAT.B.A12]|uniref:excinuclease ABC subunit UvrA n=1 Tax=unclassified Psychromonas TaxID=2614957 RepID=UPI0025AEE336|nr:excinuclease ABC subunit UvrA [Psychromonas sp. 14N.309.X.WAT.B.A12]MDN2663499.1 excinuclease ABC subunit UvrA [Psychromonas sp. 14N.309.X.WAT.B.A12]